MCLSRFVGAIAALVRLLPQNALAKLGRFQSPALNQLSDCAAYSYPLRRFRYEFCVCSFEFCIYLSIFLDKSNIHIQIEKPSATEPHQAW